MKNFYVHTQDPRDCRPNIISGETIENAIKENFDSVYSENGAVPCGTCEIRESGPNYDYDLISFGYSPSILGGRGGWTADVKLSYYRGYLAGRAFHSVAWIYADESGNPVMP